MSEICCRLDAFADAAERARHQELLRRVRDAATATGDVEDGLRLSLPDDAAVFHDTAAWIALERRCCPFLSFALTWHAGQAAVTVTGPPGAAALVRDAFGRA
jgi:hypothetical protein